MRKTFRILAVIVLCLAIGLGITIGASILAFQNKALRDKVFTYVSEQIKEQSGWSVEVESISGLWPLHIIIEDLRANLPNKANVSIDMLEASISLSTLLKGHVCFKYIKVDGITCQISPNIGDKLILDTPSHATSTIKYKRQYFNLAGITDLRGIDVTELKALLPSRLAIRQFYISNGTLEIKQSDGDIYSINLMEDNLQGSCFIDYLNKTFQAELHVINNIKEKQESLLTLSGEEIEGQYLIDLKLKESKDGFISKHSSKLSNHDSFEIKAEAKAPIENWISLFCGQPAEVQGTFTTKVKVIDIPKPYNVVKDFELKSNFHITDKKAIHLSNYLATIRLLDHIQKEPLHLSGELSIDTHGNIEHADILFQKLDTTLMTKLSGMSSHLTCKGIANLHLFIAGSLYEPVVTLSMKSQSLQIHKDNWQLPLANIHTFITLHSLKMPFSGHVDFKGEAYDMPFALGASFSANSSGYVDISQMKLDIPAAQIVGDIKLDPTFALVGAALQASSSNLAPYAAYISQELTGSAHISANIKADRLSARHAYDVAMTATLSNGSYRVNQSQKEGVLIPFEILQAELDLKNVLANIEGTIKASIKNFEYTIPHLGNIWKSFALETTVSTSKKQWPFQISIEGNNNPGLNIVTRGSWNCHLPLDEPQTSLYDKSAIQQALEIINVTIEHLKGTAFGKNIFLKAPFHLQYAKNKDGNSLNVTPLQLDIEKTNLDLAYKQYNNKISGKFQIDSIPLSWLSPILPQHALSGRASIQGAIAGYASTPHVKMHIDLFDIIVPEQSQPALLEPVSMALDATLASNGLSLSGTVRGNAENPMTLEGHLPLKFSLDPFLFSINREDPITATLQANEEIAHILSFFPGKTKSISGRAAISLAVKGPIASPEVTSNVHITKGSFEILDTGAVFRNIEAHLSGDTKHLFLTHLTGIDGENGTITATGKMDIDISRNFPFEVAITAKNAVIVHIDNAHATGSGPMTFRGDFKQGTWGGTLNLERVDIAIPKGPATQIHDLEVTYINGPSSQTSRIENNNDFYYPIYFDLKIVAPSSIFIKDQNLSSEWRANISLTGVDKAPFVTGALELLSGEYHFKGKTFTSKKGTITFSGDPRQKAALYVIGNYDIDNMKIEAIAKGPLMDPILSFRSNPPLPQKDILSWLLFNKGSAEITPFEGKQLRETIITLSGGDESSDVLSRIRRSVGIDRVDISTSENEDVNEVALHIGKYISKSLFISLKRGLNADYNSVSLEATLTPRLKLQAEIDDAASGKMILKWVKDY